MIVGYQRVSTIQQNTDRQELPEAEKIFSEKMSGATKDRPALQEMISYVREGDTILVFSLDRLARNLQDLQNIVSELNDKGVTVTFLTENLTFSGSETDPMAKLMFQMLGGFAEFERSLTRSRQRQGIEAAKKRGVYRGRKATIDPVVVKELKESGLSAAQIAQELSISRMSVYRSLKG